jgi:nucleotide-binding universal stress UspA family protein
MQITRGPIIYPTTGVDPSLGALPGVAAFAAALGRPLVLVHILGKRYEDYSKRRVAEAVAELNGSGPAEIVVTPPKRRMQALQDLAASQGGVLAVLPKRRGFVSRLVTMITDYEQLIIDGPLPVLALPPGGALPTAVKRVLFPIDLEQRSEQALEQAALLCARLGAELHLLHAFGADRPKASAEFGAARAAAASPAELYDVDRAQMQALADRAAAAGVTVSLSQAEGRAHTAILGYVGPAAIDLVVMATHGPRSGEDIWYGTTTARVIRKAAVPVLALRA